MTASKIQWGFPHITIGGRQLFYDPRNPLRRYVIVQGSDPITALGQMHRLPRVERHCQELAPAKAPEREPASRGDGTDPLVGC